MKQLVLASQSPRRAEILQKALYYFVSLPVYVSEIPNKNLSLNEQILDISKRKADACYKLLTDKGLDSSNSVILAADTMVCLDDRTFGKPESDREAFDLLRTLSGHRHQVKTGVYLIEVASGESSSLIETTDVFFRPLSDQEINSYVQTKEPLDKAGAYAIQGLGKKFVEKYVGDFNNVVGLPLQAIEKVFTIKKWDFQRL